ncbi:class I SAM-dependent methyltransferase [Sphingomonas sp. CCH9-H8]|uniref:class I SAM-dependent methyltransferase n=2 Tax=unclassified Sphingomonas TaxID=196159 RepID=UPI00082BBA15|nr:class I SAM-dependent methyltransferase [Sphingomonas sp. CCH9-H8]
MNRAMERDRRPNSLARSALWLKLRAGRLRDLLLSGRARSELWTRWRYGGAVHQDVSLSYPDRYRGLFRLTQQLLAERSAPRILSYGCAAGEEVVSLRAYFPDALLVGAEINPILLRTCRKLPADPQRHFVRSTPEQIAAYGPYDAIFAMAVFTRRPSEVEARGFTNIASHYPFAPFAAGIRLLTEQLAPGGLLIVEHALYRVEDAISDLPLEPILIEGNARSKHPRFDRDGNRIEPNPQISRIFRRR